MLALLARTESSANEAASAAATGVRAVLGDYDPARVARAVVAGAKVPACVPALAGTPVVDVLTCVESIEEVLRLAAACRHLVELGAPDWSDHVIGECQGILGRPDAPRRVLAELSDAWATARERREAELHYALRERQAATAPLLVELASLGDAQAAAELAILHGLLPTLAEFAWSPPKVTEAIGRVWLDQLPTLLEHAPYQNTLFGFWEGYAKCMGMWAGPSWLKREESVGPAEPWVRRVARELLAAPPTWSRAGRCWVVR